MDQLAAVLRPLRDTGWTTVGTALLGMVLVLTGCNVFGGIVPSPSSVEALADDAETALANGDTTRAVRLFERAFEKDSTNVRVRVGLGNALYADHGLDIFTLRRAAELLAESEGGSGTSATERVVQEGASCTAGARPASSERYDAVSLDAPPIRELIEHASVIERVRRLVVAGGLENTESGFSAVESRVRQIGFVVGSVTVVARGLIEVDRTVEDTEGVLFLDRESGSGRALVACGATAAARRQLHGALCRLGDAAQRGEQWLRARTQATDEAQGSGLSERLRTLDDGIRARIDCS